VDPVGDLPFQFLDELGSLTASGARRVSMMKVAIFVLLLY
jgi:hypothetical protein